MLSRNSLKDRAFAFLACFVYFLKVLVFELMIYSIQLFSIVRKFSWGIAKLERHRTVNAATAGSSPASPGDLASDEVRALKEQIADAEYVLSRISLLTTQNTQIVAEYYSKYKR